MPKTREVIHPRSDMPRKGLPGFTYSMNSLNPVPIVGGYNNDALIVVHGYEIKRGPGKGENSSFTISTVSLIENEEEINKIKNLLVERGFEQPIEFW